jgi:DNA invertase Pin-like site-specific DNA recombinase
MNADGRKRLRCALYTRKSTEEGLDQDYNSLEAQRDACEAYVKSQSGEGWTVVTKRYDDGGVSGATMERPALQRLLADIDARQVDAVVVYKVDRLTRSLSDFAKIVELFDRHAVSFVSVTQQFNTTSSMGRLTLNMLLSFAQFEREVTAERIRDKIAASKKKGLWMGGPPPLGYDVKDRKLVVNRSEARTVHTLFRLYQELGTVRHLKEVADRRGITTKRRRQRNGTKTGGKPFTPGNLYQMLSNPLYIGRIPHKGDTYPGQHTAIIDQKTWDAVQQQRGRNTVQRQRATNARSPSLLTGLVYDETGDRLCPTHASKKGKRYRYYISKRLMHGTHPEDDGWRLPAAMFENTVLESIQNLLRDQQRLIDALRITDQRPVDLIRLERQARQAVDDLKGGDVARRNDILQTSVRRIDLAASSMTIRLDRHGLAKTLGIDTARLANGLDDVVAMAVSTRLRRRGVEAKLVIDNPGAAPRTRDLRLCRQVAQAHLWFSQLTSQQASSIRAIARREGLHECDVSRTLRLAFLAPDIVETILAGRQPLELTAETLRRLARLPMAWTAQRRLLGFSSQ